MRLIPWGWSGGAMVLLNFQCRGVLLIWIRAGQGPTTLVAGAGGGCLDIFSLVYHFSFLSPSLWETARYRLKYCLKGPLNPKQPTNQPSLIPLYEMLVMILWNKNSCVMCFSFTQSLKRKINRWEYKILFYI